MSLLQFITNPEVKSYFFFKDSDLPNRPKVYFSGSFNPLHAGHLAIMHHAESELKSIVIAEICLSAYDKTKLSLDDICKRQEQFANLNRYLMLTKTPSFLSKAEIIRKPLNLLGKREPIIFLVGSDTITRINKITYYHNSKEEQLRVYNLFNTHNIKFQVYPRGEWKIRFEELHPALQQVTKFTENFQQVHISSTQIRKESGVQDGND